MTSMSPLEKILTFASGAPAPGTSAPPPQDDAGHLVLAAVRDLKEIQVLLAKAGDDEDDDPDDDGDDDSTAEGDTDHDYFGKDGKRKKKKAKGKAPAGKKGAMVKAAALAEAAVIALSALDTPPGDWVELTSCDPVALRLAGKEPYGDVAYADPGYQKDGKKRFPLNTETYIRLGLSYIGQEEHAAAYTPEQLASVRAKILAAAGKHGINVPAPAALALSGKGTPMVSMHHGPYYGKHSHPHEVVNVHEHPHSHAGDGRHNCGDAVRGDY